jgi:hypothetical protein
MYEKDLLEKAHDEFVNFITWMNKKIGHYPMIIGGWAVYTYNPYYGSKDIDVVFMGRGIFQRVVNLYMAANGYTLKDKGVFENIFEKDVKTETGVSSINIDACSKEDKNIFKEDPDKELPWDIAFRNSNTIELKSGVFHFAPKPSLLLLYKLKAMRDRIYDLRGPQGLEQRRYLEGKIFKDKADSIALLDPKNRYKVAKDEFYQFADKHKVMDIMKDSLRIIYEDIEAMRFYGADVSSARAWLEKLL